MRCRHRSWSGNTLLSVICGVIFSVPATRTRTPPILVYAQVDSVDDYLKKIFAAGSGIVVLKRAIPGVGYQA
ncbi:MAG: hypothetical protein LUQ05_01200 [Methanoregula sp.]|nr:hypothetical protein [Methanoregula sp.]